MPTSHSLYGALLFIALTQQDCGAAFPRALPRPGVIDMNSFALAARYGTPSSYQHQGEYLQLNYGSASADCQVIVLVDQEQRVAGWASVGKAWAAP